MRQAALALALTIMALNLLSCKSSNANVGNSTATTNGNTATAVNNNSASPVAANTQPQTTPTASPQQTTPGPQQSPLETLKAWQTAINKNDLEGFKKTLSRAVLKKYEGVDASNTPRLNVLFADLTALYENYLPMPFKTRDEDISGDTATYEIRDYGYKWQTIVFKNEDGEWKIEEWGEMGAGKK